MGSHIDTVRSGGRFDGIIGVLGALEVIRTLNDIGWTTQHDIEVVNFTCEEPNAFSISPLGSKLMSGAVTAEQVKKAELADGTTLSSLIDRLGGNHQNLESVLRDTHDIHGYLELHIESLITGDFASGAVLITPTPSELNIGGNIPLYVNKLFEASLLPPTIFTDLNIPVVVF